MAFNAIDTAEIQVKKPVTRSLMQKIKDSLDFLNSKVGTLESQGVPNGSFEIDSSGLGMPDSWTFSAYPGGNGYAVTDVPAHGGRALRIIHPGGAGNGGGMFESDYCSCSELLELYLGFITWSTAEGMHNKVQIRYFDKDKVYISTSILYDSFGNPTSPMYFIMGFTPPATARYYKIGLIGGATDTNVPGSAYFDGLGTVGFELFSTRTVDRTIAESNNYDGGWFDAGSMIFPVWLVGIPFTLAFQATAKSSGGNGGIRFRYGSRYTNQHLPIINSFTSYPFSISFAADETSGYVQLFMQLNMAHGYKPAGAISITKV